MDFFVAKQMFTHVRYEHVTKLALGLRAVTQHVLLEISYMKTSKIAVLAFEWTKLQMIPFNMLLDRTFIYIRPGT